MNTEQSTECTCPPICECGCQLMPYLGSAVTKELNNLSDDAKESIRRLWAFAVMQEDIVDNTMSAQNYSRWTPDDEAIGQHTKQAFALWIHTTKRVTQS